MTRLLESGLCRLAELQPESAGKLLPRVVHLVVPLLAAEQDGVRYNASGALQSLLKECLTPQLVAAMQRQQQQASSSGPPALQSLVAAVASSLGARYQESWGLALPGETDRACSIFCSGQLQQRGIALWCQPSYLQAGAPSNWGHQSRIFAGVQVASSVRALEAASVRCLPCCAQFAVAGVLCEVLAAGGAAALATPVVSALGQICAGLSDEAEQREQEAMQVDMEGTGAVGRSGSNSYASAAEAALGTAIRCVQQVLECMLCTVW